MAVREQVSGPGPQSKRTDMNVSKQPVRYMSGGSYGEGQENLALQGGAGMYQEPTGVQPSVGRGGILSSMTPGALLTDSSNRPNEPLTAGMSFGDGPNFTDLNLPPAPPQPTLQSELAKLIPADNTGKLSAIYNELF
jgi:hypothetical protein